MIYFDNAATTNKKPLCVHHALECALNKYSANPGRSGHKLSLTTAEMIYKTRKKAASFFNAKSEENVVFTTGCTMSINMCLRGLLKKGDHILISDLEHNSVHRTVVDLARFGVEFSVFETFENDDLTIECISKNIRSNTKAVVCIHGSNVFGIINPIEKIGVLCKKKGVKFIVDAAQTAGVLDIDVQSMNIDYLCVPGHKGLYGIMGTGVLICDDDLNPFITGGTGSSSLEPHQPSFLPDKYESGTLNVPGICALSYGIDFVQNNKKRIIQTEKRIVEYIYQGLLDSKKVVLYNEPNLPVLSFNIKGESSESVARYLDEHGICVRAGLHCSPLAHKKFGTTSTGTVRVSPSAFNNIKEADYFVRCIKSYKKQEV